LDDGTSNLILQDFPFDETAKTRAPMLLAIALALASHGPALALLVWIKSKNDAANQTILIK